MSRWKDSFAGTEGKASWRFAHLFRPMYAPRHAGGSGANMGQPSDFLRPLIGEKNERAISLARSRPLDSDLRRSGSASESQLRFSPNHLGLTNLRSHAPRSSKITIAARTCSPPPFPSCLARVSLPIPEDDCLFALSSGRSLFR